MTDPKALTSWQRNPDLHRDGLTLCRVGRFQSVEGLEGC